MSVRSENASTDIVVRGAETHGLKERIRYRPSSPEDGRGLHRLVREGGGLELNTGYAYVLLCDHFASTTVVAEAESELCGFVAAYVPPERADTVFVWQIGVHSEARGMGVAGSLLDALINQEACRSVRYLEATVTPSNAASRRLFESFATRHGAPAAWSDGYPETFFDGSHEPELLIRVGPLDASARPHSSELPS